MTIASLDTPASGGSSRSRPLDARNQEKAANSECVAAPRRQDSEAPVVTLAPPPPWIQEPVKLKRRRDAYSAEVMWVSKKQRPAVVAAPGLGKVNRAPAASAPSPPIVREQDGNEGHGAPGVDHWEEEEVWPREFAATAYSLDVMRQDLARPLQNVQKPVERDQHQDVDEECWLIKKSWPLQNVQKPVKRDQHQDVDEECWLIKKTWPLQNVQKPVKRDQHQSVDEECWLIKKRCHAAVVPACNGRNDAVGQVNSAAPSTPSPRIQDQKAMTARRRGRMNTKLSDCKTTKEAYVSLTSGLRCLGVTNVIPVLAKILTPTDSCLKQARLQFSPLQFMDSPLRSMLTSDEYTDVHTMDGLPVEALDRHGCSYDMRLGFVKLTTGIAYRLRKEWTRFLTRSGVREGNLIEVGAFRVHGRLVLTLLNYSLDGSIPEEMEAVDGLLMLSPC